MKPRLARLCRVASLTSLVAPAVALAQGRFDNAAIPLQFLETSPWTVSAGARFSSEGASVNFGQLGAITTISGNPSDPNERAQRNYHNGVVGLDAARGNEMDAAGNVFSTPGGRYAGRSVDANGNETFTGDYLAYDPNRTRSWGFGSADQVSNGVVSMDIFSTRSAGGAAVSDSTVSGGFEVNVGRRLRRFGRKVELGVSGTFGLNDINAGTSGSVTADLVRYTDYYRLYGNAPTDLPYTGPSFENIVGDDGTTVILLNGRETTTPIDQLPFESSLETIPDGALVLGSWKINGAYYVVRVGPVVRIFITDRLAISFEAGLAAAFVSSRYEVRETVEVEGINPITTTEEKDVGKYLAGFYGSGSVEYWMTERTNAYAGAAYESLDNYQQSVGGRTAEIDISSTVTVRMGLTTRF